MVVRLTSHGLDDAAKKLRQSDQVMRREFTVAVTASVQPIIQAARRNALQTLPRRGGLGALIAQSTFTVLPLRAAGMAGARIITADHDPRLDTEGRLRHPVYGRWLSIPTQRVPRGWFTTAARKTERGVRARMNAAARVIAKKIA